MTTKSPALVFLEAANAARSTGEDALADALMRAMRRHVDTLPEIDTRHAAPDADDYVCGLCGGTQIRHLTASTYEDCPRCAPCEVDEPSIGDEVLVQPCAECGGTSLECLSRHIRRVDSDRSPRGADVFRSAT